MLSFCVIKYRVFWFRVARRPLEISWGISGSPGPRVLMNVFDQSGIKSEALVNVLRILWIWDVGQHLLDNPVCGFTLETFLVFFQEVKRQNGKGEKNPLWTIQHKYKHWLAKHMAHYFLCWIESLQDSCQTWKKKSACHRAPKWRLTALWRFSQSSKVFDNSGSTCSLSAKLLFCIYSISKSTFPKWSTSIVSKSL